MNVEPVLVDRRNIGALYSTIKDKVATADFIGLDLETEDSNAHEGILAFRKGDSARVFDINRTTICGLSIYCDGDTASYYFNLAHADRENRLSWSDVRPILEAKRGEAQFIAHKAPFEITMLKKSLDFDLKDVICTMQMAVTAYGPDEYDPEAFHMAGRGALQNHMVPASRIFADYMPGAPLTAEQSELLQKVVGKASRAAHSYNGFVGEIAYGYSLKKAVKSHFGVQMQTFKEVLGEHAHMGELTGPEVVSYGCDDAYWAVRLFHHLLNYMVRTNPAVIKTFFEQENPMIHTYADVWMSGMRVNTENVLERRIFERKEAARLSRELKAIVRELLPYPEAPNESLMEHDGWFSKNEAWKRKRKQVEDWAKLADVDSDYEQCLQSGGAVSNAWAAETGAKKPTGVNLTYWQTTRSLIYDLLDQRAMRADGKVQSDADAQDKLDKRLEKLEAKGRPLLKLLKEMAGVEQRMKLYLTPYTQLMDPDTGRMYPELSSMLATRRMASSNPNPMQLAKNGPSSYIRGFFLPDEDDHVLVSLDWSQIELVLIGEFSGDPEFVKAYGQRPYEDLHTGAAADCLGMTIAELKAHPDYKIYRRDVGKAANFNYWYSGALSTVGENLGWSPDRMWEATDAYRRRFAVAEAWRVEQIRQLQTYGYVELPDHTRRVRFEATQVWQNSFFERFAGMENPGIDRFIREVIKKIQRRAGNQGVNSLIQGTCSTLAKRSEQAIRQRIHTDGFKAKFKIPIHDELLYSVHREEVPDFIKMAKRIMLDHPDIVNKLVIDASASVGLTFEPWSANKSSYGQIEVDEAPDILGFNAGCKLNDNEIATAIEFLYEQRKAA